jgi:outer membrane receptor for ferrienterochelin and colicins
VVHTYNKKVSFYFGVKNLWNWTPNKGNPFIIARANDPFDKQVKFIDGVPQITPDNPSALTFDPTYVYAPNQSRRFLFGIRCSI